MTNTEIWLDEIVSHIQSVKSDMWMLREIMSLPNCNDCKRKDCSYKPKWGEHIRYNCPLHADRKTEPQTCSVNGRPYDCGNCEYHKCMADEPQTDCKTCRYGEVDEGYVRCAYYSKATEQTEPQTEPLPKAINGIKIADAVAWADKWLDENHVSEMWHMIRTLRDATEWQL